MITIPHHPDDHDLADFGAPPALDRLLTADDRVAARWTAEIALVNKGRGNQLTLHAASDVLDEIVRIRKLPRMPWPTEWPLLAERLVVYPGDVIALIGGPGSGKTQWAVQHARSFAAAGAGCVLWLPLELTEPDIGLRIPANLTGRHVVEIRERWTDSQIAAGLATVTDRWRFIDVADNVDDQLANVRDAIEIAKRIYGSPPLVVMDYAQLLALLGGEGPSERSAMSGACENVRRLTMTTECYTLFLSQTSRGNTPALAGHVEFASATDAMGMGAESSQVERCAAHQIVLQVFKADDAQTLDVHQLVNKVRNGGREGKVGARYHKAGGVWEELDHLPATPIEVTAEVRKSKKRKGANGVDGGHSGPIEPSEARAEINARRSRGAAALRREAIIGALRRAGDEGMGGRELRKVRGTGSAASMQSTLRELVASGRVRADRGQWVLVQ